MSKPLVFLDMDGVIADFRESVNRILGTRYVRGYTTDAEFVVGLGTSHTTIDEIMLREDFWSEMPRTPEAYELVKYLKENSELYILSSPQSTKDCFVGKLGWMLNHFGINTEEVILNPNKHLLSKPGRLLIDDYELHCRMWAHGGGTSFQWNNSKEIRSSKKIEDFIEFFQTYSNSEFEDVKGEHWSFDRINTTKKGQ